MSPIGKASVLFLLLAGLGLRPATGDPAPAPLRTVADVLAARKIETRQHFFYDLTGTVRRIWDGQDFILTDGTGANSFIYYIKPPMPAHGDLIRITGSFHTPVGNWIPNGISRFETLGKGIPEHPRDVSLAELARKSIPDYSYVRIEATVDDIRPDDISAECNFIVLKDGLNSIIIAVKDSSSDINSLSRLIGARIRATGSLFYQRSSWRQFHSPIIVSGVHDEIEVVTPPPDPFAYPPLGFLEHVAPEDLIRLGRRTTEGRVLATWPDNRVLVQAEKDQLICVHLTGGEALPAVDTVIKAVGDVTTDHFHLLLGKARIRHIRKAAALPQVPIPSVSLQSLFSRRGQRASVDPEKYGCTIRVSGTLGEQPQTAGAAHLIRLRDGEQSITVDASSCPEAFSGLSVGSDIQVTGVFVFEAEPWHADAPFPRIDRSMLILNRATDLSVLRRPPPLTPRHFLWITSALLALLLGFTIWNRILNRLVERRSKELLKAQISRISETLRVDERTRLAVELHDSLSQNLSGVAFQAAAAQSLLTHDPGATRRNLETVQRMLLSCRAELKRCLWDLREDTLAEKNFSAAVERTLRPVIGTADLIVRFNVPRERLSDPTAHAVLCILRELASNAVRHGHARTIRVAGECHDGRLSFSVRDDGTGFDVRGVPATDGVHFGLSGIRERVKRHGGAFTIASQAGDTRATVTINLPQDDSKFTS